MRRLRQPEPSCSRSEDRAASALPLAIVLALGISAAAIAVDHHTTSGTRPLLPTDKSWIDDAAHGSVAAIATPISSPTQLELQLFWNPSVNREFLLPDAIGSDAYATAPLRIGSDGSLLGVPGDFLFDFGGSTATFSNAAQVARFSIFGLYRPLQSDPRFRLLIEGYLPDHWLVPQGRIRAWKLPGTQAGGRHLGFVHALATEEAGRSPRGSCCETEGSRSSRERASALCAGAAPTRSSFHTPRRTRFSTATSGPSRSSSRTSRSRTSDRRLRGPATRRPASRSARLPRAGRAARARAGARGRCRAARVAQPVPRAGASRRTPRRVAYERAPNSDGASDRAPA